MPACLPACLRLWLPLCIKPCRGCDTVRLSQGFSCCWQCSAICTAPLQRPTSSITRVTDPSCVCMCSCCSSCHFQANSSPQQLPASSRRGNPSEGNRGPAGASQPGRGSAGPPGGGRGRGRAPPRAPPVTVPNEDFDFEEMMKKFNKQALLKVGL